MHIRVLNTKNEKITSFKIGWDIAADLRKLSKENRNQQIQEIATVFVKMLKPKNQPEKWSWEQYTLAGAPEAPEATEEENAIEPTTELTTELTGQASENSAHGESDTALPEEGST